VLKCDLVCRFWPYLSVLRGDALWTFWFDRGRPGLELLKGTRLSRVWPISTCAELKPRYR
jgi:hypothetical protein